MILRLLGWVGFWTGFGLLDYWATKHGFALSRSVREVFRTDTRPGRFALGATLFGGATVLYLHLTT